MFTLNFSTLIKWVIRYRIRFQISDHTTTTSCTLFDEEAKRILNTSVTDLLDSLVGKSQEVPKIIQQLCGQRLIFRFKLNNKNLTLGMQNYAVKKTFMPDDKLEMRYLDDKAEEVMFHFIGLKLSTYIFSIFYNNLHCAEQDLMDSDVDDMLKQETNKLSEPVIKVIAYLTI